MYEQQSIQQVLEELHVDQKTGLTEEEAARRLDKYGPNTFQEKKPKTKVQMFIAQLRDPMIYILFAATGISLFLQEVADAFIILTIILLNATIGMVQEAKAEKSLEALKKLSSPTALVRREGKICDVEAAKLVPGDIVILEAEG